MAFPVQPYLAVGIGIISAGIIVAFPLALPTPAGATGGLDGSGGGTITGPGGTPIGSASGQVVGTETVPGGTTGIPGCITGGCSGSLTAAPSIAFGPGTPQFGSPGLQINPTINLPSNPIDCIIGQCHGGGSLVTSGGAETTIVGATGGLNGFIHG